MYSLKEIKLVIGPELTSALGNGNKGRMMWAKEGKGC